MSKMRSGLALRCQGRNKRILCQILGVCSQKRVCHRFTPLPQNISARAMYVASRRRHIHAPEGRDITRCVTGDLTMVGVADVG